MRLLFLFLLFTSLASAQEPAGRSHRFVRFLTNHVTVDFYAGAASGFASGGTFYCRSHNPDVEHCSEKYGAAGQFEVARGVWTLSMIALSEYGRKQKFKEWFVPALGTAAFNTYWGIRQFRTKEQESDSTTVSIRRASLAGVGFQHASGPDSRPSGTVRLERPASRLLF